MKREKFERPFIPEDGNNVPVHSPLIPTPMVPYYCENNRGIAVYTRVNPEVIKRYLENTPFEYVDNTVMVYIQDFTNTDKISFWDCGVVCTAKYKDIYGGYFLYEYEDQDYSIAAGREMWGYPKKFAEVDLVEHTDKIVGTAVKDGVEIIRIELNKKDICNSKVPDAKFAPHLLLHTVPNGDRPGIFSQRVMGRDTSPDFKCRISKTYNATLSMRPVTNDALDELASGEIICGTYTVGEYFASEENGWAKVLGTVI